MGDAKYGRLDPKLAEQLATAPADAPIDVFPVQAFPDAVRTPDAGRPNEALQVIRIPPETLRRWKGGKVILAIRDDQYRWLAGRTFIIDRGHPEIAGEVGPPSRANVEPGCGGSGK